MMATRNRGKLRELEVLLAGIPVELLTLEDLPGMPEVEETGETFLENATLKAVMIAQASGILTLADDSGLVVDALGGRPGVYSARFAGEKADDWQNNMKLLRLLKGVSPERRTARFVSSIAVAEPNGRRVCSAEGRCEGVILEEMRGTGGFGYDPLFYIPELGKTMAELTMEEKNQVSHRGKAFRNIARLLRQGFN